ncbi:MAG: malto-oligosyltrehalose trehalohydrolase [Antricoccus sp.]
MTNAERRTGDGVAELAVWAPNARSVAAKLVGAESMQPRIVTLTKDQHGWWRSGSVPDDAYYGFLLDGSGDPKPDPRSRRQPEGVHGLSRLYDPAGYRWSDQAWTGRQLAGSVIYELHVGTFTEAGTLDSAIERIGHLVELGIDLVELMPVNAFNGPHGWGYDGVQWYAVQHQYGGPAAYQRFVDAAHQAGLGVIQDVVYNHLGPSGNYLPEFGPYLSTDGSNAWGSSVNLDGEDSDEVRQYIIENALMWLRDYHVDGLRLDAVHALVDNRAIHILEELSIEVSALSAHLRRPLTLIAESDLNDPRVFTPREAGGYGVDAQWSDDFHHALLANLTGDVSGYYADFGELDALAKVIETGFYHDGTISSFRGRRHGRRLDTPRTPAWRLVVCSDNHDQIGNRADGSRLRDRLTPEQLEIAAVLTLLAPATPMLFMGEEWGASTPFAFFSSHPEPELAEAVRTGRREEFAKMDWAPESILDPQAPETFADSKLKWAERNDGDFAEQLALYRDLIRLRRTWPELTDPRFDWTEAHFAEDEQWFVMTRGDVAVVVNFAATSTIAPVPDAEEVLLAGAGAQASFADEEPHVQLPSHGWAIIKLGPINLDRAVG